jgi:hypothetical protein
MSLIVKISRTGPLEKGRKHYQYHYRVLVGIDVITEGVIKKHNRSKWWGALVKKVIRDREKLEIRRWAHADWIR